ncbi:MAG: galactokinase family protein, partial [Paeniclostridium sordellii]|nr:galactokinase family protein [Paeniclostridium sordellii]
MRDNILNLFKEVFGERENIKAFFSPGRVNLIGEHTDYNGGNVFPCALSFGTYGAISLRNDNSVNMYSKNF